VEDQRMRVADHRVGHRKLLDAAVARIEAADVAQEIAGKPDDPLGVHDQIVRPAAGPEIVLLELARRGHEVGDVVARLAAKPDAVRGRIHVRIARPGVGPWHWPFFDDWRLVGYRGCGDGEETQAGDQLHGHSPVSILRCTAVRRRLTEPSRIRSPTLTTTPPR